MKILFPINAFYPSQIGGPCNTLYWHCCALKNNKVNPAVFTTSIGIQKNTVELDKWIESECGNVYYSTKGVVYYNTLKMLTYEIANTHILHLNSLFSTFSIFSFIYKSIFHPNKKLIWSVRGELNNNALNFSSWKKIPILFLYKMFNKNIVYHSTSIQETVGIQKIFPKNKTIELPNFIATSARLQMPNSHDLLYVGRIHPIKSLHKLISGLALSKVFLESSAKLFIVGKHEQRHDYYKKELLSLIDKLELKEKIVFKGHLEGDAKEKMYASSYALVLPSETENFGNVVVESLNQGTPVIASKGTPWEILEKYNAGFHVSNEPEELAKAIDKMLLMNKEEYKQMRLNSCNLVDENFKIDTQIYKWIALYENLLNDTA
jgi:glycosyltransferase involved in cell wall biosynthesis